MAKQILNRREPIYAEEIPAEIADTSGYIEATDYATDTTGGTVKVDDDYGVELTQAGFLRGTVETAEDYDEASNNLLVSKGTLDNILATLPTGGLTVTECWSGGATESYANFTTALTGFTFALISASTTAQGGVVTQDFVLLPVSDLTAETPGTIVRLVNNTNVANFTLSQIKGRASSATGFTAFKVYGIK